ATRNAYESWENIGGMHPGYAPGVDASYVMGLVYWLFSGGIATAHTGNEVVAELELASLGFQGEYSVGIGNCLFWSGFWVYDDEDGQSGFDVAVVKPDGSVSHHWFSTRFPKGNWLTSNHFWWGGWCYGTPSNPGDVLSRDGRYCWTRGGNVALSPSGTSASSDAYAYCVDSWTGAQASTYVCGGHSSVPDDSDTQGPDIAYARIMNIYNNGEALVKYHIPDETGFRYKILSSPGGSEVDSTVNFALHEQDTGDSAVEADQLFVSVSNPVSGEVEVVLSLQLPGEQWSVTVYDIAGRQVASSQGVLENGSRVLRVDTGNLSSGLYLLQIKIGDIETVRSISIVH
ncbi:MAG: T9SS type A sorting domain-containing protein, partial [Candidatus Fermentibacteraceae bacterium]|nr:T9SS type A sorting domain-containing protein [Candidatus Fermentibacteraceae bacterium]